MYTPLTLGCVAPPHDWFDNVSVGWAPNRLPHAQCFLNTCFARFPTDYVAICGKRLWLLPDNISVHEISLMTSEIAEIYSNILDVFRGRCRRAVHRSMERDRHMLPPVRRPYD